MSTPVTRRTALGALAASARLLGARALAENPKRPNIIVILADDMGFSDLGCYGSEIATPHLDSMAKRGLRFSQFYNTPRCCPSRAALLTGLYPHQAGVGHMDADYGKPAYRGFLNDRCVTIAEALRPAGYRTMMVGKWHVGFRPEHWPRRRGFDRYFGTPEGGGHYFGLMRGRTLVLDDDPIDYPEGAYITDLFSDRAVAFIDEAHRGGKPFFLYLAHIAPHYPLHALVEDYVKYRGKYLGGWDKLREERHRRLIEAGLVDRRWPLTPRDPEAKPWQDVQNKDTWDCKMAVYAAQIDCMDRGIGRILAKLRELGIEDDTLVLFLSDNGACSAEVNKTPDKLPGPGHTYRSYGLPWANASNTPFRLYKRWVHEGGIATPLVVQWPAGIREPGTITHQVGHITDIMATCLDLAGAEYPEAHNGKPIEPLVGKSLVPILRGQEREGHKALFWEHEGNRGVRSGNWKLVSRHHGGWELYDLEADRTELHDLAGQDPKKAAELRSLYNDWAARCHVEPWPAKR